MKIENISEGMRIASYPKLCELLGEKATNGGNAKQAQLKRWKQYFSYSREKNAFIITEIYSIPKQSDDKRIKYAQYLKPILLKHLACFGKCDLTFERWYVALGMMAEAYFDEAKIEEIEHFFNLSDFQMQKLIYTVKTVCQRTLLSTLKMLEKEQFITYTVNEYIVLPSGGRRIATKDEQQKIQKCKDEVMSAVGASKMFSVNINPKRKKAFYEKLHKLYKENYGWDRTYELLEIVPVQERVEQSRDLITAEMVEKLSANIKKAAKAALESELENANRHVLEEWENDTIKKVYRIDQMTVMTLTHILMEEI